MGVLATGCTANSELPIHELAPQKWRTGEVLRQLPPMVERVPSLHSAVSVVPMGRPAGEPDGARKITVPGPTDGWIDAVVTFARDDHAPGQQCGDGDMSTPPDVVPELAADPTERMWRHCVV